MYSPIIKTDFSFMTDVSPKCLVKSAFFWHNQWVASGLLSLYTTPPFWSFLAPMTFTPMVGQPSCVVIFNMALLAFYTKLLSSRLSRRLVWASRDLSTRICLLRVWFHARVPACVVGSCLLRASAYVILAPV